MSMNLYLLCGSALLTAVGFILFSIQLYRMISLDAQIRGMEHPELWGLSAAGRGGIIGLYHYFVARRQYPIANITATDSNSIRHHKLLATIFLTLGILGAILMLVSLYFL